MALTYVNGIAIPEPKPYCSCGCGKVFNNVTGYQFTEWAGSVYWFLPQHKAHWLERRVQHVQGELL